MEDDFTPDYTFKFSIGQICNKNSHISADRNLVDVSINNKLTTWNIRRQEVIETRVFKHNVSVFAFSASNSICIGFDNGIIKHTEGDITYRPHTRRVTRLLLLGECIISASVDGSIVLYDKITDQIKIWYKGNTSSVVDLVANELKIFAICADNTIKIWNIDSEDLVLAHVFDGSIMTVVVEKDTCLVFFKNGKTAFFDLVTKAVSPWDSFKYLRNVKQRGNFVVLQTKKKIHTFAVGTGKRGFMKAENTFDSSDKFMNFAIDPNKGLVFLTKDNCLATLSSEFGYHKTSILGLEPQGDKIFSLSSEVLLIWLKENNEMSKIGSIELEGGTCLCVMGNYVVLGTMLGVKVHSLRSYELLEEVPCGRVVDLRVSSLASDLTAVLNDTGAEIRNGVSENYAVHREQDDTGLKQDEKLGTGNEELDQLYKKVLVALDKRVCVLAKKVFPVLTFEDPVVCMCTSMEYLAVSLLNSKIYLYDPSLNLKLTLYGHSLPARYVTICDDKLLSCGADKLVKLWGTKFGECRKSFVGDAKNAEFVSKDLFVFGTNAIEYYKKHSKLSEFKCLDTQIVKLGKDSVSEYMVSAGEYSLSLFTMNEYEFMDTSSSNEEELLKEVKVADIKNYDKFLVGLEKLESINFIEEGKSNGTPDLSNKVYGEFFDILERIDSGDIDTYMHLLDSGAVISILEVLRVNYRRNIILSSRVFINLVKSHNDICTHYAHYTELLENITDGVKDLREMIAFNEAVFLMERDDLPVEEVIIE